MTTPEYIEDFKEYLTRLPDNCGICGRQIADAEEIREGFMITVQTKDEAGDGDLDAIMMLKCHDCIGKPWMQPLPRYA